MVQNLHMCFHMAFAADIAHTVLVGENSTYLVNVSMNTIINLKVITSGSGPVVSMEIRCIGRKVETTNREALIIWLRLEIFWHVTQLCM